MSNNQTPNLASLADTFNSKFGDDSFSVPQTASQVPPAEEKKSAPSRSEKRAAKGKSKPAIKNPLPEGQPQGRKEDYRIRISPQTHAIWNTLKINLTLRDGVRYTDDSLAQLLVESYSTREDSE